LARDQGDWDREYLLWNETGLRNVKPSSLRYGEFPEGWDVIAELRRLVGPFVNERILELGCGYGRLCRAFPAEHYIGVDINSEAIARARQLFPAYRFQTCAYVDEYPSANVALAYTVFLHLPDDALESVLARLGNVKDIFIAEILNGKDFEKNTDSNYDEPERLHSVYHRSLEDYERIVGRFGLRFEESVRKPYYYYPHAKLDIMHFRQAAPAPVKVYIPQDLRNPGLRFDGIYDDGWAAGSFSVELARQKAQLVVAGMNPGLFQPLEICVEGITKIANDGDFRLAFELDGRSAGAIEVQTNSRARLPCPDGRQVSFLLREIGFEP